MSVSHFRHVALSVPDVPVQKKFYEDFGLVGTEIENRAILRCRDRDQDQVILVEGPERRLHHLCYGATEEGLAAVVANVEKSELANRVDGPKDTPYEGVWFEDFEQNLYNVHVSEPAPSLGGAEPIRARRPFRANGPGHYDRVNAKGSIEYDSEVVPRRLGHVLQFTTSFQKKLDFYVQVMGMKLSDTSAGLIAFLRPPGGSDHHTIAFLQTDRSGFHHASFEVDDIDMVGLGGQGMLQKGYRNGWGLGRHALGSNFFWYIRDPHDGLCEYFADIDYIADDDAWQPKDWPMEVSFYLWGPNPPEEFGMNFEGSKTTTKPSAASSGPRT